MASLLVHIAAVADLFDDNTPLLALQPIYNAIMTGAYPITTTELPFERLMLINVSVLCQLFQAFTDLRHNRFIELFQIIISSILKNDLEWLTHQSPILF